MPPEKWLELTIRGSGDLGLVSQLLLDLGGGAVEEREGALITYLPPPLNLPEFLDELKSQLRGTPGGKGTELHWRWQPHQEWERLWRQGLGVRRITSRILVAPSWEEVEAGEGELLLIIDPGLAFGTAEHATTRSCLRMLDRTVHPGTRLADVGAGSGILSIAAAGLGAREIWAFESDPMACETAVENVERNGAGGRVVVEAGVVDAGGPLTGAPFDGLVANMQTHLILPLLPLFSESTSPEGWIILSGVYLDEDATLLPAASRLGLSLEEREREDGWWTGLFRKSGLPG